MSTKTQYVEIPPNAARTLAALRELGYDSLAAISDLIDNSLDAGATHVSVTYRTIGKSLVVEVGDDGSGMSRDTLQEALRLGSDVEGRDAARDLGKYGMGLVTASLSIAKTIFVATREKGKPAYEATFDVSTVERHNKWVLDLKPATRAAVDAVGEYGTVVRLTNVDRIDTKNTTRLVERLRTHIGRVFRNFINEGVQIKMNNRIVPAFDPLMREHPETVVRHDAPIDLGRGKMVRLTIVELPDLGPLEDEHAGIVPQASGFYVVRNKREIVDAQTFGMYKHHHSYSHFRAELVFGGDLDHEFHVDVKKTSINPNPEIVEKIAAIARKYLIQSGQEGKERAVEKVKLPHKFVMKLATSSNGAKPTPHNIAFDHSDHGTPDQLFTVKREAGQVLVDYNKRHPLVKLVAAANSATQGMGTGVMDCMALALAEVAKEKGGTEFLERFNKALFAILAKGTELDTWEQRDKLMKKS